MNLIAQISPRKMLMLPACFLMMIWMQGCAVKNSLSGLEAPAPKQQVKTLPPGCSWAITMKPPDIVIQAMRKLQESATITKEEYNAVRAFRERLYVNDKNIKDICKKG